MKLKKWLRYISLIGISCIIISLSFLTVYAYEPDMKLSVRYGYHEYGKLGYHIPVFVTIENNGEDFDGELCIYIPYQKDVSNAAQLSVISTTAQEENYIFQKEIHIDGKDNITENMQIPVLKENQVIEILVKDSEGRDYVKKELLLNVQYAASSIVLGTVLQDGKELTINTILQDDYQTQVKTVPIDKNSFPKEWIGLELFDIIIFDRASFDALTDEESAVFKQWEQSGGMIRIIDEDEEYEQLHTLYGEEALRLLVGEDNLDDLAAKSYAAYNSRYYDVIWMLNAINVASSPDIWKFLLVLLFYIASVGPLTYILLKRYDKRNYTWACVVVLSLFFSFIIYLMGNNTRFRTPFLKYVTFLDINDNMIENTYFTIQAPYNHDYKFYVDKDCSVIPLNEELYSMEEDKDRINKINIDYNIAVKSKEEETEIEIRNLAAFTEEAFLSTNCLEDKADEFIKGKLNSFEDELTGEIVNESGHDLENAILVLRNRIIKIGSVGNKERIDLQGKEMVPFTSSTLYKTIMKLLNIDSLNTVVANSTNSREDSITYEKLNALNYCIQSNSDSLEDKAMLIGFDTQKDQVNFLHDVDYDAYGITCITANITDVNYQKGELRFLPYVREHAETDEGYYDTYSDTVYGGNTIITYHLEDLTSDIVLRLKRQEVDKEDVTTKVFDGKIYLLNNKTQEYDLLDYGNGEAEFSLSSKYITKDNTITLKYEVDLPEDKPNAKLPFISMTGRYQDAADS